MLQISDHLLVFMVDLNIITHAITLCLARGLLSPFARIPGCQGSCSSSRRLTVRRNYMGRVKLMLATSSLISSANFWGSVPTRALIMISQRYTSSLRFGRSSSCWRFGSYNLVGVIMSYVLFVEPRDLLCSFWWLLSPF